MLNGRAKRCKCSSLSPQMCPGPWPAPRADSLGVKRSRGEDTGVMSCIFRRCIVGSGGALRCDGSLRFANIWRIMSCVWCAGSCWLSLPSPSPSLELSSLSERPGVLLPPAPSAPSSSISCAKAVLRRARSGDPSTAAAAAASACRPPGSCLLATAAVAGCASAPASAPAPAASAPAPTAASAASFVGEFEEGRRRLLSPGGGSCSTSSKSPTGRSSQPLGCTCPSTPARRPPSGLTRHSLTCESSEAESSRFLRSM
mmetsp:Transcript_71315/g.172188  ORF Transcript_71315/g.172188 Transcript_71315/m.172188 type:complete len:257 (+) Transcript_71315:40-810(+)